MPGRMGVFFCPGTVEIGDEVVLYFISIKGTRKERQYQTSLVS